MVALCKMMSGPDEVEHEFNAMRPKEPKLRVPMNFLRVKLLFIWKLLIL